MLNKIKEFFKKLTKEEERPTMGVCTDCGAPANTYGWKHMDWCPRLVELTQKTNGVLSKEVMDDIYEQITKTQAVDVNPRTPLNDMAEDIFMNAVNKGWWEDGVRENRIPEKILLMHAELSEAVEEWRDGYRPNQVYDQDGKPEGMPIELADTIIRILDFCYAYNIDIDKAIKIKMEYNKDRPYRHGGKKI